MCASCEAVRINGIYCHEHGCPEAWKTAKRNCKECGCEFVPEDRFQITCSQSCYCAYNGLPDPECEEND